MPTALKNLDCFGIISVDKIYFEKNIPRKSVKPYRYPSNILEPMLEIEVNQENDRQKIFILII